MLWPAPAESAVRAALQNGAVPGLVIGWRRAGQAPKFWAGGTDASGLALTPASLFPVASITKLATALATLRLVAAGALDLDAPLTRLLPEAAAAQDGVTPRTLLCHTSGLPYELPPALAPYAPGLTWKATSQACLQTPLAQAPRQRVTYSNVGIGLLSLLVERLTRQTFSRALQHLVLEPLGIEGYLGVEPPRPPARIARETDAFTNTPLEPFNSMFWRSLGRPWGGLVTTAAGALALVEAFAGQPPAFLPAHLRAEAVQDQTGGLSGGLFGHWQWARNCWGLGVELRGEKAPHWTPPQASAGSFGHIGSTGCLAWHDPAAQVSWVILGPRSFEHWCAAWPGLGAALLTAP